MFVRKISVENYRGIKERQEVNLLNFSTIIGKNDSGKSIILHAAVSFLDIKTNKIEEADFNDIAKPIIIECGFTGETIRDILSEHLKKFKKEDGQEEFIDDLLFDGVMFVQKKADKAGNSFSECNILMKDFKDSNFSKLYEKSDEDLNKILEEYKIEIPVSGKGRNSKLEKIKFIKKYCSENNIELVENWVSDDRELYKILPEVELFASDYGLIADISFKTNSVLEIKEFFDKDKNQKFFDLGKEVEKEMQRESMEILLYMQEYASSLENIKITPNIVWKDAVKSVDVKFKFLDDNREIPMTHKGAGYRRLFMVARFRYLAKKNKGNNTIFLIEEPETFLHPSAQEDLISSFKELSEKNQIIITTHSPVFAGATNHNSIILCKKTNQSVYENAEENNKEQFLDSIIKELGIRPCHNLFDSFKKVVFVESKNDVEFYNILSKNIFGRDLINDDILVLPFGGDNIDGIINIKYFKKRPDTDLFLILDSDKHCPDIKQKLQQKRKEDFESSQKCKAILLKKSSIENYYHPRSIERIYNLDDKVLEHIGEKEDVKKYFEKIKISFSITKNMSFKNNFDIWKAMKKEEWEELVEQELKSFIQEVMSL